nr:MULTISPECIES: shikimate kinase [unclassified Ruminococcus]
MCGFMGCGKTTVGKIIAKKTYLDFIDMDRYIEEKEGCTVKEIFDRHGEDYFRDLEHQACIELANRENCIISSGGGSLIYERNVKALEKNALIVYLSVPLEDIKYRLRNDKIRPLLQRPDKDEAMAELYNKREPLYMNAARFVIRPGKGPGATADKIIEILKLPKKHRHKKANKPQ